MEWQRKGSRWTSGKFEIVCRFYYFQLYHGNSTVGQYNTLQMAQDEAKNYKI